MNISRQIDNVQCRVCGFQGPSASAANCPRCRTAYYDGAPSVFSKYGDDATSVLGLVTEVLGGQQYEVAVVRKVAPQPGLFHVGGLRNCNLADLIVTTEDKARFGDVLYLSYEDRGHRVLRWGVPVMLRSLVTFSRRTDPVQCRICGFEGPAANAASCPRCRTGYYDGAPGVFSKYGANVNTVLVLVKEVLADYPMAVVRKVAGQPGLFHVGSLRNSDLADSIKAGRGTPAGNVLYLSYEDNGHCVLPDTDSVALRSLLAS